MASKTVGVILSVKDCFTSGFKKFKEEVNSTSRETRRAQNQIKRFGQDAKDAFSNFATNAVKSVSVAGAALAGLGIKTGLSEALDLEGYRQQLNTATKDTTKAAKIMTDAVNMANATPFEAGELVEAAAKFESMGMSANKWLTLTGDMAAATNKSFDQATEALIDAQTGELERLKKFGITKAMIGDQAEKMFTDQQVINNKGQIVNQEKFNEALIALMKDKYAGGMEAQANTVRGAWSTVTGVTKSALATLVGMSSDGSLRSGSALDTIKTKVQQLGETFERWQQDGTLDRFAKSFDAALQQIGQVVVPILDRVGSAFKWIADNANWLVPIVLGVWSAFKAYSIINGAITAFKLLAPAIGLVNGALKVSPIFLIAAAIGGIITILTALGINWTSVFETIKAVVEKVKEGFGQFMEKITSFQLPSWVTNLADTWLPRIKDGVQTVKDLFGSLMDRLGSFSLPSWVSSLGSKLSSGLNALKSATGHATGTSYFAGGVTRINEGGRGETVVLPSGTQIIPHDVAKKQPSPVSAGNINVTVQIQGNVIGNSDFANYIGKVVSKQIVKVVKNR